MRRMSTTLRVLAVLSALLAPPAAGVRPALAGDLQKAIESRWRGAWALTSVDVYSDCAGLHTNNRVNGNLVSSKGRFRFRPGELMRVEKVDLKRSRLDLTITLPEPILLSHKDGPFTLYNEARCLLDLEVELPRSAVARDDVAAIDAALRPILIRHASDEEATRSRSWNGRKRDPYPEDYDITLAEHAAWKAQQVNAGIQARLDKAMEEAARLADRVTGDSDYLKGFAAGVEAMRAVDLTRCGDLTSRDIASVGAAPKTLAASFVGEAATRYTRGYQDGQRLVFALESLRRLPACMLPVPEVPNRDRRARGSY